MHIINAQRNRRPSRAKAKYNPNQIFFGKKNDKYSVQNILGHDLVKIVQTEFGLDTVYKLVVDSKNLAAWDERIADRESLYELREDGVIMEDEGKRTWK